MGERGLPSLLGSLCSRPHLSSGGGTRTPSGGTTPEHLPSVERRLAGTALWAQHLYRPCGHGLALQQPTPAAAAAAPHQRHTHSLLLCGALHTAHPSGGFRSQSLSSLCVLEQGGKGQAASKTAHVTDAGYLDAALGHCRRGTGHCEQSKPKVICLDCAHVLRGLFLCGGS